MAVDALGAEQVHCVMLPYAYTSRDSLVDAEACAKLLGVRYDVVPIKEPVEGFLSALEPMFEGTTSRHHGRKYPVAHARRHPHGDLQQVRLAWC